MHRPCTNAERDRGEIPRVIPSSRSCRIRSSDESALANGLCAGTGLGDSRIMPSQAMALHERECGRGYTREIHGQHASYAGEISSEYSPVARLDTPATER